MHNPVTAIAEADATGEIATIFADIRQAMEIPLITFIKDWQKEQRAWTKSESL